MYFISCFIHIFICIFIFLLNGPKVHLNPMRSIGLFFLPKNKAHEKPKFRPKFQPILQASSPLSPANGLDPTTQAQQMLACFLLCEAHQRPAPRQHERAKHARCFFAALHARSLLKKTLACPISLPCRTAMLLLISFPFVRPTSPFHQPSCPLAFHAWCQLLHQLLFSSACPRAWWVTRFSFPMQRLDITHTAYHLHRTSTPPTSPANRRPSTNPLALSHILHPTWSQLLSSSITSNLHASQHQDQSSLPSADLLFPHAAIRHPAMLQRLPSCL